MTEAAAGPGARSAEALRRVGVALRGEGGLLADALDGAGGLPADDPALGGLAAAGPRAAGREAEMAFVVEAIREGYLLHYGTPRLVRPDDPDLALLAGDRLYALGLDRLAQLGDLDAVAELADVIALCAMAHAEGSAELAEAAWTAGATAVGWGADAALHAAKEAARGGRPEAADALRAAARARPRTARPGR